VGISIVLVGLVVVLIVANVFVYQTGRVELEEVLDQIIQMETGGAGPSAAAIAPEQEAGA
jgi:hypothetical protein